MGKRLIVVVLTSLVALFVVAGCSKTEVSSEASTPASSAMTPVVEDTKVNIQLRTEPYYILIIGNDSRNDTVESKGDDPGRTDTLMVARIDPKTYHISLLTIPRDTPVFVEGDTYKINKPYKWYGAEYQMNLVSDFTGIKIDYYLDLSMAEFVKFFNEIGGVDINVPIDMGLKDITTGDWIDLTAGDQHLNGNEALVLSRVRKMFTWGDPCRQYSSRHMIENTITLCANDPALAAKNLDSFLKIGHTNWPKEELALQIEDFCAHADQIAFTEGTGPYDGAQNEELNDWFCYEDSDTWKAVIDVFTEGGDPTTVLPLAPFD